MSRKAYLLIVAASMAALVILKANLPAKVIVVNVHQAVDMNFHRSGQENDMDDYRLDEESDDRRLDEEIDMDEYQEIDMDDYGSDEEIDRDDHRSDQDIDVDSHYSDRMEMNLHISYHDVDPHSELQHRLEPTMPFAEETKPAEEILNQEWAAQIREFLKSCSKSSPVAVVVANYPYRDVIINWLVAARVKLDPPLENILVISFDSLLQELMQRVGIKSIQVPPDSALLENHMSQYDKFLIARVTVLRLINYWGYDVAHYDTDAIILKNPQLLYNKHADSDVIGSTGTWPYELGHRWGFTLCMGVILFRSTLQTDLMWGKVKTAKNYYTSGIIKPMAPVELYEHDDQVRLNYALFSMNITWKSAAATVEHVGEGAKGLKVTALSQSQVCRMKMCDAGKLDQYYVWHKGGQKSRSSKIMTSSEIGSWYLKKDWEAITRKTTARGVEWLREISVL